MEATKNLMNLEELAKRYSMSLSTLRRWASERRFPLYKISSLIRVSESEFNQWLEKFKIKEHNNDNQ